MRKMFAFIVFLTASVWCVVQAEYVHKGVPLTISKREVSEQTCLLPEPLAHGIFSNHPRRCPPALDRTPALDSPACRLEPGTAVPSRWVLYYSCDQHYRLSNNNSRVSICQLGQWLPALPACLAEYQPCGLPQHPRNGVYKSNQCEAGDSRIECRNTPGTMVPNDWVIRYSCNTNYNLSSYIEISVCDNGVWINPLDCIKLCPPLRSLSVDVRCFLNGREETCDQPMKPNTTAKATCKQHYKEVYNPEYSSLLCQDNGEWSYPLFYCAPDCGVSLTNTDLVVPIENGATTRQGEFPWLAALYRRGAEDRWEQKCLGTLISPHIVLTAAHCLVLEESTVTPQNIKVGLGKYHRDFYKNEKYSMIYDVREVVTPRFYRGGASFYAVDIGLLDLVVSVQVTAYIMPACVDWSNMYPINSGTVGHLAGWGTTENQKASETILSAQLNYTDNASCIKLVRPVYQRLITHDKFCAISINGSQVDKGYGGGGLTVARNGLHFVVGIVSTKIIEDISFSVFTDISNAEHHAWLEEHRTRLNRFHVES